MTSTSLDNEILDGSRFIKLLPMKFTKQPSTACALLRPLELERCAAETVIIPQNIGMGSLTCTLDSSVHSYVVAETNTPQEYCNKPFVVLLCSVCCSLANESNNLVHVKKKKQLCCTKLPICAKTIMLNHQIHTKQQNLIILFDRKLDGTCFRVLPLSTGAKSINKMNKSIMYLRPNILFRWDRTTSLLCSKIATTKTTYVTTDEHALCILEKKKLLIQATVSDFLWDDSCAISWLDMLRRLVSKPRFLKSKQKSHEIT